MVKRTFSSGGGRQSTAALVLAAQGRIEVDNFIFCNVGEDAENPATLAYVRDYAMPYAKAHGVEFLEIQRKFKDGRDPSLYQYTLNQKHGAAIPMKLSGGHPVSRSCTYDWKIRTVAHYLKEDLGWAPPWEVLLGISWDESFRMSDLDTVIDDIPYHKVYPLCEMKLTVADCRRIVREAGLPPAPSSSCWFCPNHRLKEWARLRLREPELFEKSVELERIISERSERDGFGPMYMTNRAKPLDVAVPEGAEQLPLLADDDDEACTSGYCWT